MEIREEERNIREKLREERENREISHQTHVAQKQQMKEKMQVAQKKL